MDEGQARSAALAARVADAQRHARHAYIRACPVDRRARLPRRRRRHAGDHQPLYSRARGRPARLWSIVGQVRTTADDDGRARAIHDRGRGRRPGAGRSCADRGPAVPGARRLRRPRARPRHGARHGGTGQFRAAARAAQSDGHARAGHRAGDRGRAGFDDRMAFDPLAAVRARRESSGLGLAAAAGDRGGRLGRQCRRTRAELSAAVGLAGVSRFCDRRRLRHDRDVRLHRLLALHHRRSIASAGL